MASPKAEYHLSNSDLLDADLFRQANSQMPEEVRHARWRIAKATRAVLESAFTAFFPSASRIRDLSAAEQERFEVFCVSAGFSLADQMADRETYQEAICDIIDRLIESHRNAA